MLLDLSDAVLSMSVQCTVTRFLPTPVVAGRKQGEPRKETFDILASVQPVNTKQLQLLPEGQRSEGAVVVYSVERLCTAAISKVKVADLVTYEGVDYEVQTFQDWMELGGYYFYIATRLER